MNEVCWKYERKISGLKIFSKAWIDGSENQRTSNVIDHATSNQHVAAMVYFKKDQAKALAVSLPMFFTYYQNADDTGPLNSS